MRVFITGGGSFIGRALWERCAELKMEVSGLDSVAGGPEGCVQADIRSPDLPDILPEGTDAVVHLAALSSDGQCRGKVFGAFDVNVMGTLNMARAAALRGVRQLVFASSEWVYGDFRAGEEKTETSPIDAMSLKSEYAITKLAAEMALQRLCPEPVAHVTVLRFGIVYGPRAEPASAVETLFLSVRKGGNPVVGSVRTGRCFVHVRDIAESVVQAMGVPGFQVVNIQADRLVTLGEIIMESARVLRREPPEIAEKDPHNPSVRRVSNAKARRMLGWNPSLDIVAGLQTLAAFADRQEPSSEVCQ